MNKCQLLTPQSLRPYSAPQPPADPPMSSKTPMTGGVAIWALLITYQVKRTFQKTNKLKFKRTSQLTSDLDKKRP